MSSVEIKRTTSTTITARTQAATGHRVTVDHFLWMAKELKEAVDAGMPVTTEVRIDNPIGVNGVSMSARAVLIQEIP